MPALLELDHVGLSYHTLSGEIPALSEISFSIQEGEFVSLVGAERMREKYRSESDRRTSDTGTGTDHHAGTSTGTFRSLCRIYAAEGSSFRMADYI